MVVPAVSALQESNDKEIVKTSLIELLDKQVIDYNQAVSEQNHQKIMQSVEKIDSPLMKLSKIGYTADFSSTSQVMKGQNSEYIPTTVKCEIKEISEGDVKQGHSFTASKEQLKLYNELTGVNITTGEFLEKVFPDALNGKESPVFPPNVLIKAYELP